MLKSLFMALLRLAYDVRGRLLGRTFFRVKSIDRYLSDANSCVLLVKETTQDFDLHYMRSSLKSRTGQFTAKHTSIPKSGTLT